MSDIHKAQTGAECPRARPSSTSLIDYGITGMVEGSGLGMTLSSGMLRAVVDSHRAQGKCSRPDTGRACFSSARDATQPDQTRRRARAACRAASCSPMRRRRPRAATTDRHAAMSLRVLAFADTSQVCLQAIRRSAHRDHCSWSVRDLMVPFDNLVSVSKARNPETAERIRSEVCVVLSERTVGR